MKSCPLTWASRLINVKRCSAVAMSLVWRTMPALSHMRVFSSMRLAETQSLVDSCSVAGAKEPATLNLSALPNLPQAVCLGGSRGANILAG